MKEIYRERDYTRVGYFQSVLEAEGVETMVRNRDLGTMVTGVPIPDMYPALCVLNDADYVRAREILSEMLPLAETDRLDDRVTKVFVAGVMVIFGGLAALQFMLISVHLSGEEGSIAASLLLLARVALVLFSLWVIHVNLRKWRNQREVEAAVEVHEV